MGDLSVFLSTSYKAEWRPPDDQPEPGAPQEVPPGVPEEPAGPPQEVPPGPSEVPEPPPEA